MADGVTIGTTCTAGAIVVDMRGKLEGEASDLSIGNLSHIKFFLELLSRLSY
jgi:hypothetical protein